MVNTQDINSRRLYMLELLNRQLQPSTIQSMVAKQYKVTTRTVRKDMSTIKEWLPVLMKSGEDSKLIAADLTAKTLVIYKEMLNIVTMTKNPSAKVGAARTAIEALKNLAEIKLVSGDLKAPAVRIEQEVKDDRLSIEELSNYIGTIVKIAMGEEAGALDDDAVEPSSK